MPPKPGRDSLTAHLATKGAHPSRNLRRRGRAEFGGSSLYHFSGCDRLHVDLLGQSYPRKRFPVKCKVYLDSAAPDALHHKHPRSTT